MISTSVKLHSFAGMEGARFQTRPFLASNELAFEFDGLFLLGSECQFVLEGPKNADAGDVAALGADEAVDVQPLNVIQCRSHDVPFDSGLE